eukprot:TRINITY_DN27085_c0_g1_i1.p1 TRINITY_DN27085_c0_g1~~TRINITY_DN27085_c0_g1_i1.p1  ORF type:complete len:101 (+),score=23.34 TRINITY_DN27085_c0_g1_i1:52-354(+)
MGEIEKSIDVQELLKPFYQRASEAEERLSRLEAALVNKKDVENEQLSPIVVVLQSKLETAVSEREQALKDIQKLETENAKLHYRIIHLLRALESKNLGSV